MCREIEEKGRREIPREIQALLVSVDDDVFPPNGSLR